MVGRGFVCRRHFDDIGVAAGPGPDHHADRHRMRQLRFNLAGDSDVLLLVRLSTYFGS